MTSLPLLLPPETANETSRYLIDYKEGKVFLYNDNIVNEMKNVSLAPAKITFLQPFYDEGAVSIDRTKLTISGFTRSLLPDGSVSVERSGKCRKIALPNLSASGKQI